MTVSDAVRARRSVRGYLDKPVAPELVRRLVAEAARAPSGGNLQPWHIYAVSGAKLAAIKARMAVRIAELPKGETMEYEIYPSELPSPYSDRRFKVGEDLYGAIGIPREDRAGRRVQFNSNFRFFDAPVGLFCYVHRTMGPPQWSDLGMYLQSLMLLAVDAGLATCAQECWALYPQTIAEFIAPPPELMLFCGVALGYEDPDAKVNRLRAERAPLAEFASFIDI